MAALQQAEGPGVLPRLPARRAAHRQPRVRGRRADQRQRRHRAQPRRRGPRRQARARQHARARRRHQRPQRAADPPRHRAVRRRQAGAVQRALARDRPALSRGGLARSATSARTSRRSRPRTTAPDFSQEPAEVHVEAPTKLEFDKAAVGRAAQALLGQGAQGPGDARHAAAWCSSRTPRTSSTARAARSRPSWTNAQLSVSVGVKADDGMNLSRLEQRFGRTPADLPPDAEVDKMIATVTGDLDALHDAPLAEPYVGPAILEGRAAGVFFHEVFGHRIEGHRQKDLTSRPDLRVVRRQGHRARLAVGLRRPARSSRSTASSSTGSIATTTRRCARRRVSLIDHGKLVGFLMGRNPIPGLRPLQRPRPALAGAAAGGAPGQPRRRGRQERLARRSREAADRGDQEAAPAVRHDLHRHQRRLHEHLGVRAAGVQGQPGDGVPAVSRRQGASWSAASTSAARRWSRCSRSAPRAARSRRSTACAAPRAAGCRCRRRRRRCCSRSSRSRRASSRRIGRRCCNRRRFANRSGHEAAPAASPS